MITIIQPRLWGGYGFGNDKQVFVYIKGSEIPAGVNLTESSPAHRNIIATGDVANPTQSFIDFPPGGWTASWVFVRADKSFLYYGSINDLKSRPFTLECWVKITLDTGFDQVIMQADNGAGDGVECGARANNAWVKVGLVKIINVAATVVYGTWQRWVVTRDDSNNLRLYINGALIGSAVVGSLNLNQRLCFADSWVDRSVCMTGSLAGMRFSPGYCRYRNRPISPSNWPTRRW